MRRRLTGAFVALAVVVAPVGVAKAELADIPVFLDALGTVVPRATVRIRPQVNGVMTQVLFKEGQMVKRGQLLATIDARPYELALQQAIGQRMRDEAQLAAARVTLARYETLLKQYSIARQDVDTQRATVHQLEAAVVSDKAQEGSARLNVSYTRIVAPVAGRIGLRNVDVGNQVSTSDTNGIAVVTTLTPIEVQFGGKPLDPRFNNKRTEMYWELAEWLRSGACIPDMPELKVELCTPTYDHDNARGVMRRCKLWQRHVAALPRKCAAHFSIFNKPTACLRVKQKTSKRRMKRSTWPEGISPQDWEHNLTCCKRPPT